MSQQLVGPFLGLGAAGQGRAKRLGYRAAGQGPKWENNCGRRSTGAYYNTTAKCPAAWEEEDAKGSLKDSRTVVGGSCSTSRSQLQYIYIHSLGWISSNTGRVPKRKGQAATAAATHYFAMQRGQTAQDVMARRDSRKALPPVRIRVSCFVVWCLPPKKVMHLPSDVLGGGEAQRNFSSRNGAIASNVDGPAWLAGHGASSRCYTTTERREREKKRQNKKSSPCVCACLLGEVGCLCLTGPGGRDIRSVQNL